MITDFSDRILRLVSDHESHFPGTAGFVSAIADARTFAQSVPPSFLFTFYLKANPQAMGSDPAVVFPRLLEQTEGWLGFIVHSVAYRLGQFLDDLITGMNAARPYRSVGAARSLMELSAFVHHHTKKLVSASTTLAQAPEDFPAIIKGIIATLGAASHFAQVTRFNWGAMVRGDMDEFFTAWDKVDERVKATQILTLIDKLPGEEKRAARFFYEMLCDYVHPNVGAHTLVVSKAELLPEGQMRWELSREPDSDEALSVLVHAVAIPVRASIRTLLPDLEQLQCLQHYFGEWKRRCESLTKGEV
jgi:hypothetical protein